MIRWRAMPNPYGFDRRQRAMRQDRWLTLSTAWQAINAHRFVAWIRRTLAPCLRPGDIVVLDKPPCTKTGVWPR